MKSPASQRLLARASVPTAAIIWLMSISSTSAEIITGLVHHWTLDETSGLVAHDSAGSNDVQLSGFPNGQSVWVPGMIGGSLNFFSPSNYALTNDPIVYSQYTISFWLKVNGPGGINPRLVGPRDGHESWVLISSEFDRGVGFYYNHGAQLLQDPDPPAPGVWEQYTTTLDLIAETGAVYRNGSLVASGFYSDQIPSLSWVFGANQDPDNMGDTLNGQLDDIRIYNRVLSPAEISQLASVPEPSSIVLTAMGGFGLAARRWRARRGSKKHS